MPDSFHMPRSRFKLGHGPPAATSSSSPAARRCCSQCRDAHQLGAPATRSRRTRCSPPCPRRPVVGGAQPRRPPHCGCGAAGATAFSPEVCLIGSILAATAMSRARAAVLWHLPAGIYNAFGAYCASLPPTPRPRLQGEGDLVRTAGAWSGASDEISKFTRDAAQPTYRLVRLSSSSASSRWRSSRGVRIPRWSPRTSPRGPSANHATARIHRGGVSRGAGLR